MNLFLDFSGFSSSVKILKLNNEETQLKRCYFGLVNWYISWVEEQEGDQPELSSKIIEKAYKYHKRVKELRKLSAEYDYEQKIEKYRCKIMKNWNKYQRQYIIWNISVYLMGMITDENTLHSHVIYSH